MEEIRCERCGKKLGVISGKAEIKCPKCKHVNTYNTEAQEAQSEK